MRGLLLVLYQFTVSQAVLNTIPPITAETIIGDFSSCMNHDDCIGANRRCLHNKSSLTGACHCKEGYEQKDVTNPGCSKKTASHQCDTDYDCREGEVCIILRAPYFADRFLSSGEDSIDQKICIGTWLIYAADLEEPKTGGGLRSKFYPDDIFFKRSRRVPHQYLGFVEDMMLILFLVCILITLVTVHRASCYRQFQDARRNTPLRHILPIAEDQPPPYSERIDSADGLVEVVEDENTGKRQSETPPPTYEEALYRNSVLLPRETSSVEIIPEGPITIIDNSLPSYNETRIRVFENSISIIQEESNVLDTCSTQPSDQSPPTLTECTVDSTEEKEETSLLPHEGSGSTSESSLSGPVCTVVHEEQTQQNEDDRASVSIIIENKHEIISSSAVQVIV